VPPTPAGIGGVFLYSIIDDLVAKMSA